MKTFILLSTLLMSASAMAFNCEAILLKQKNPNDLSAKILEQFENKGFRISQYPESELMSLQGSFTLISIEAIERSEKDVEASVKLIGVTIKDRGVSEGMNMNFQLSKKTLMGSAKKSLLKSIENSIPNCISK